MRNSLSQYSRHSWSIFRVPSKRATTSTPSSSSSRDPRSSRRSRSTANSTRTPCVSTYLKSSWALKSSTTRTSSTGKPHTDRHSNLNPERVLLDKEGHVKLCDFGVYSVFEWPDDKKMGTMSEAIDYKSPEQVRGDEFDFRTDFWQLV